MTAGRTGDVLGYARVSTVDQDAASQHDRLEEAGMTPGKAARQLGIGRSTAYRLVRREGPPGI